MNYYIDAFKKGFEFDGRTSRKGYWMFVFINVIIMFVLVFIDPSADYGSGESLLAFLYQLIVVIPSIAISIRRMHDVDRSGWFSIIPIYGLLLLFREGTKGSNQYGPDPITSKNSFDNSKTSNEPVEYVVKEEEQTVPTNTNANTRYCGNCGVKQQTEGKFCSSCGVPLG